MSTNEKLVDAAKVLRKWASVDADWMGAEFRNALDLMCSAAECGTLEEEPAQRVTCAECRWWRQNIHQQGRCMAHPPRVFVVADSAPWSEWPETNRDDFCGEAVRR